MRERVLPPQEAANLERSFDRFALPRFVTTPYPFVAIGDLAEIGTSLGINDRQSVGFERELLGVAQRFAPTDATFYFTQATDLTDRLDRMAEANTRRTDKHVGVVLLDKYLGTGSTNPDFNHLRLSRNPKKELISRVGVKESPEEQMANLTEWAKKGKYDELLLVDDVLAYGSTVPPLVEKLTDALPGVSFGLLVGLAAHGGEWKGIETVREKAGIETQFITSISASPKLENGSSGMAIPVSRDVTIFGGKAGINKRDGTVSYPYILPFSDPLLSLIDSPLKVEGSHAYFDVNRRYIRSLEAQRGSRLTFADLVASNYGLPHTSLESMIDVMKLPTPGTELGDYLEYAQGLLVSHERQIRQEVYAPKSK